MENRDTGHGTRDKGKNNYILEMKEITKDFPGVRALDDVTFNVKPGEIHALVGENGAGKSTLMKILSGVYPAGTYEGTVSVAGDPVHFADTKSSERTGIAIIYQELVLIPQLSIAENICVGNEVAACGVIDWERTVKRAEEATRLVGLSASVSRPVSHLGVGEQQLVAIAKALAKNARILILDEPTAALSEGESATLFGILRDLKERGVTCIYISHRLKEVFQIADRVTVLRDGKTVATHDRTALDEKELIALMVGRELKNLFPRKDRTPGEVLFEVRDWTAADPDNNKKVERVSFSLKKGEVLGMAGLIGAGRTELVMSLFGSWGERVAGEAFLDGMRLPLTDPAAAIAAGISLATEDRKRYGLILDDDVCRNISLASLDRLARYRIVDVHREVLGALRYVRELRVKTPSLEQRAGNLSGGNQQKVVLGKWLMTGPRVLILDEPTRGIDVGAKAEIYGLIEKLVEEGVGVIVVSSDLIELLGVCDRILVMHDGRVTGELPAAAATQEKIMYYATGGR